MSFEKLSLFNTRKEFFTFLLISIFIFTYSLLIEFNNYENLTRFKSNIVNAILLKQYEKTKLSEDGKIKTYQVLKLKSDDGFSFYTIADKEFPSSVSKKINLEVWAGDISFYEYMSIFYAFSIINSIDENTTLKQKINSYISKEHGNSQISEIYQALYTAAPLSYELQSRFSTIGVSHLLAISGFHLGVLGTLLFFLFKMPYKFFQNRYFPYRSYKVDSFVTVSIFLLLYLLFLDTPASLLRAFVMLIIGFVLYDRGYKLVSMESLFLTVVLVLAFFPRLIFSLGFWLSAGGVFYIFLFLTHFKNIKKPLQFTLIPIWVYLMMLPHSLYIFENFSIYHPLSVIWSIIFVLFYPLSIFLHLIGAGDSLDIFLVWILDLGIDTHKISIPGYLEIFFILISFFAIFRKKPLLILTVSASLIFVYSLYRLEL